MNEIRRRFCGVGMLSNRSKWRGRYPRQRWKVDGEPIRDGGESIRLRCQRRWCRGTESRRRCLCGDEL